MVPVPRTTRIPALDGLRGIAVLSVIVFHDLLFGAGWIGVQLFFVISGFLITSNLVRDKPLAPGPYFAGFYKRRSLRIFPVYYAYLALLAVFAATTNNAHELFHSWPTLVTYTYNFTRLRPGWTFTPWFAHFWSLCIEEQFYLVWPAVVYLLPRARLRLVVVSMLVAGPACRAVTGAALTGVLPTAFDVGDAVYWFTPSQMDGFAFGAMLVVFQGAERLRRPVAWLSLACAVTLGLGLVNLAMLARSGAILEPVDWWTSLGFPLGGVANAQHVWSYTMLDLTSALLVLCAAQGRLAWLEAPWLVWVGRISYGAYVVHRAIILIVRRPLGHFVDVYSVGGRVLVLCVVVPATLVVAGGSYRWFERRLLALGKRAPAVPAAGE
jgi:peptidoglycan/LPS O-acetylase OafA/YrhL